MGVIVAVDWFFTHDDIFGQGGHCHLGLETCTMGSQKGDLPAIERMDIFIQIVKAYDPAVAAWMFPEIIRNQMNAGVEHDQQFVLAREPFESLPDGLRFRWVDENIVYMAIRKIGLYIICESLPSCDCRI